MHKKPNYVPSGIPFVTVRNLTAGPGISFEKLNYITPEDHDEFIKRANPEPGDVLVSKDGTLGVIRVINTDVKFSIFVSVAMVKPVVREMSNFLGIALSAPQVQSQMIPKGSGLQHIHLEPSLPASRVQVSEIVKGFDREVHEITQQHEESEPSQAAEKRRGELGVRIPALQGGKGERNAAEREEHGRGEAAQKQPRVE